MFHQSLSLGSLGAVQYAQYNPLSTGVTESGEKHCFRTLDHWPSAATKRSYSRTDPLLNSSLTLWSSLESTSF